MFGYQQTPRLFFSLDTTDTERTTNYLTKENKRNLYIYILFCIHKVSVHVWFRLHSVEQTHTLHKITEQVNHYEMILVLVETNNSGFFLSSGILTYLKICSLKCQIIQLIQIKLQTKSLSSSIKILLNKKKIFYFFIDNHKI